MAEAKAMNQDPEEREQAINQAKAEVEQIKQEKLKLAQENLNAKKQ